MTRGIRIKCPNCGRILGDTNEPFKANLNCNGCKKTIAISMSISSCKDYLKKGDSNDESK